MNDGLPSSQIYDVHLDEDGLVWFATAYGLVKFDGYDYETYTKEHGLNDELIYDIFEDSQERFWVSTEMGGVGIFDSDSMRYHPDHSVLDSMLVNYISESPMGEIWFGTNKYGVLRWDGANFTRLDTTNGMPSNTIWDIQFFENNEVWISTSDGLGVYKEGEGIIKTYQKEDGLSERITYQTYKTSDGTIWVPTSNGITKIRDGELSPITEINGDRLGYVYNINQENDGTIWIGTERRGIYWYKPETKEYTHITRKNGLSSNYIYRLIKAIDGTIWVTTDGNGVSIFKDKKFKFFDNTSELKTNTITSLYKDQEGAIWYGSHKGIGRYKDGEYENFYTIPEDIFADDEEIWDIERLPNGNLVLLTYTYWLIEFDGENFFRSDINKSIMSHYPTDILVDDKGEIWMATERGVIKYQKGDVEFIDPSDEYWKSFVTILFQDSRGNLWIGTEGGIAKKEGDEFKYYTEDDGLKGKSVYEIKEDSRGNIWVGTNKGISVIKRNAEVTDGVSIETFETNDVYLPETISLLFDNHGGLWQGTNGGLNYYDVEGWYATGNMDKMHFSLQDYGKGAEFNGGAALVGEEGNLWFGTARKGLMRHEPNEEFKISPQHPPLTFIRQIYANGELVFDQKVSELNTASVDLEYHENNLEIEYGAVNYKDPYRIFYRYKLNGFDEDWNEGFDRREAVYTNLSPGEYTFLVMSKSVTSDWSDVATSIAITIEKPFWLTWWFILLALVATVSLFFLLVDIYLNKVEKKKLKVLVDEQTKDLKTALFEKEVLIKEIHHRVKNNMAVVSGLLDLQSWQMEDGDAKDAIENSKLRIKTMSTIHEKLYQNDNLADINIHDFVYDLIQNISNSLKAANQNIEVKSNLEVDKLDVNKAIPCGLLLNELISNSYEHAFPNNMTGEIFISIKENRNEYHLCVRDNGVGIPRDILSQERTSLGITLIESLTDQIGGTVEFINGEGTIVNITFPK
ncbi:MAG: hypothetical protein FH748_11255 [Balneolaceae bacterium]|nr:hypothetical protein [Balneolaceae bacterium]